MWKLYDALIEEIPSDIKVVDYEQTNRWTFISTENNVGTAMIFEKNSVVDKNKYRGACLQDVAALIKSWDFQKASIGLAAINSYFNHSATISDNNHFFVESYTDVFDEIKSQTGEERIGMIGHFPFIDRYPERKKDVTIFELNPKKGDYPASASEFLLPEMEKVYITGSTLVNKTLPRLLELSRTAKTILVGGSTPLSCSMFDFGVDILAGTLYNQTISELIIQKKCNEQPLTKFGQPIVIRKGEGL